MFVMHDPLIHDLGFRLVQPREESECGILHDHPNRKTWDATRRR